MVRLGAPVGVTAQPGLKTKAPFIDNVISYDTRLLLLEPPTEQVILGDQKRLEVQTLCALPHHRPFALLSIAAHARTGA